VLIGSTTWGGPLFAPHSNIRVDVRVADQDSRCPMITGQVPYHYFTCLKILLGMILHALLSLTVCVVCVPFVLAHRLLLITMSSHFQLSR